MAIQMFPIEINKQMEWYRSIFVLKIQDSYQRIRIDKLTWLKYQLKFQG